MTGLRQDETNASRCNAFYSADELEPRSTHALYSSVIPQEAHLEIVRPWTRRECSETIAEENAGVTLPGRRETATVNY